MNHLDQLGALIGFDHVIVDEDVRAAHEIDWTRRWRGRSLAVVRPASTAEVASVVQWCRTRRVPIVPQGGNTGLVGGSVPDQSGLAVVLSTRRLNSIRDLDPAAGQATVEAGVTLAELDDTLAGPGWEFGVDLAARQSATLGGMAATNAGGTRVLRHGTMRANVLGVEAVLGTGVVVSHLDGLIKDNTGYDLAGLLCGSEGTLGVITALRLRLVAAWPDRMGVAVACESWTDAVELAARARRSVEGLEALEAVDAPGIRLAREELGLAPPVGEPPVTLFVMWAGRGEPPLSLVDLVGDRRHAVGDPQRIFECRDRQSEAIARTGIPHKLDVTLPLSRLAEFTLAVKQTLTTTARIHLFGHLGDGNLHVNVLGVDPEDESVDEAVLRLVAAHSGSISAEHGIGRAKSPWLHLSRTAAEIGVMRDLKRTFDPAGIMNPGVLFSSTVPGA